VVVLDLIRQRLGLVLVVVAVLVLLSATRFATFMTDLWWYDTLALRGVYFTLLGTQLGLAVVFGLALALLVGVNLVIARRLKPLVLPANEREAVVERYRQMADPYVPWIIAGVALLFALSAGGAVAAQWDRFLLWRNAQPFGWEDPQFGRDAGYFVFELPWLSFVQGWLFTSLILTLLVTAGAHYLLGAIRPESPGDKVTPQAKAHLSVLLGLTLIAHGWGYWLDRFHLNFSTRGTVTGASYTDIQAELPALNLLLVVTAVAIALVLWNIRQRGWLLPGAALGILVVASIVLQGIYPAAIQRLRVDPQELAQEREFISRNLDATRFAYGLDDVEDQGRFTIRNDLQEEDLEEHELTIQNVRLWDPQILETTYQQLQALRPYYSFNDVDVDRYEIDGQVRQVMISVRELQPQGLEEGAQTWQNLHLTYTHGFGAVASQVNAATQQGQPVFLARDIPPAGDSDVLMPDEPGVYFGEAHRSYSIVNTDQPELDYEDSETDEQVTTRYAGEGDVPISSVGRRSLFALRFADPNFILSGLINEDSGVIFHRNVQERIEQVAPFLHLDDDPYAVVLDRRIVWVQDAYTTSAHFPYSERRTFRGQQVNYIRNSVKAVVDAYDGTISLYVTDPDDPVIQAWQEAFPAPFVPLEDAPETLEQHFRYPVDMFTLQSEIYRLYHIPEADEFYSRADAWDIPPDAAAIANGEPQGTLLRPYYLLMRLPGEEVEEFVLIQPYLARNKPNMIAWLAGRSDPGNLGNLLAVRFPGDQTVLGTAQAQARIEQDPTISEYITLRTRAGSNVIRGNQLVIPIENSIVYVEPLFIENPQARIPELAQVAVVMGDRVVMEPTLDRAMRVLVGADDPDSPFAGVDPDLPDETVGDPDDPDAEEPEDTRDADELIEDALAMFAEADEALRDGDLAGYQNAVREAQQLLEQAAQMRGLEAPPADEPDDPEDLPDGDGTADLEPAGA
jgi:uncharacterized protein